MNEIIFGDCRETMRRWAEEGVRVQTCVTSPPYFGLRDYGHDGQLGLEQTPEQYVAVMIDVFRLVRDLLADDGTLWLNIGDTANNRRRIRSSSHQPSLNGFKERSWAEATKMGLTRLSINDGRMKEKDMMGIPWMLAFALRADGWFLRQEIIWAKNFGKPEPSLDRLPSRHEQMFILSKSKRYYFDRASMPEYASNSVWHVAPIGTSGHAAAFAANLIEPCILAGSRPGDIVLDPFMGSGTTAQVAIEQDRQYLGCELNREYKSLQDERIDKAVAKRDEAMRGDSQMPLFDAEATCQ